MTDLRFQDAGSDVDYLLEALAEGSDGASSGGAIFAWSNSSGARAFFGSASFEALIHRGVFTLVVGTDSITDEAAVQALIEFRDRWTNLKVDAFVHDQSALFHPKLAWFSAGSELRLIVGSGNLTMGGLKGNWEAFSFTRMSGQQAKDTLARLDGWLAKWQTNLVPLDHPRVRDAAKANTGSERSLRGGSRKRRVEPEASEEGSEVLLAEIPKVRIPLNPYTQSGVFVHR